MAIIYVSPLKQHKNGEDTKKFSLLVGIYLIND